MRKTIFLIYGISLFIQSYSQDLKITLSDNNENNKEIIKSNKIVREEIYKYEFNKNKIKDSFLFKIIYYNKLGDKIAIIQDPNLGRVYKDQNVIGTITTYTHLYDSAGKLRKFISDNAGLDEQINFKYEYDSLGNIINKFIYTKDTSDLTIEHSEYNTKNELVKIFTKINDDSFYNSTEYFYSENDSLLKETILDNKGNIMYSYTYEYSLHPNKKTTFIETKDGKRLQSEFFYNDNKQLILENNNPHKSESSEYSLDYKFFGVNEYSYNPDKTFYQWTVYSSGKKTQLTRHYYFTK